MYVTWSTKVYTIDEIRRGLRVEYGIVYVSTEQYVGESKWFNRNKMSFHLTLSASIT